jgi:Ion channel
MFERQKTQPDLWLLLSLVVVILAYPILDHGVLRRLILGVLNFLPIIVATVRLSKLKGWVWSSILLMLGASALTISSMVFPIPALLGMKWFVLTVFFGLTAVGLFSYLQSARSIASEHLYTAVSIYLMLGLMWFALYNAIDTLTPGAIVRNSGVTTDPSTDLLYFSLVTLSTVGYGDIVAVHPEVRMLAALESIVGVLYIAIMVAILVSAYRRPTEPS